jgi:hypothetical protein
MKKLLLFVCISAVANATSLNLYNTGQDNAHVVLAAGSTDPHYIYTSVFVLGLTAGLPSSWLANDSVSKWIGPDQGDGSSSAYSDSSGARYYRMTFDLTGFDPATAVLSGRWAADGFGFDVLVNGVDYMNTAGGPSSWYNFTLYGRFYPGINFLDFGWTNTSGPGGIRVEWISATADPLPTSGVPEPASVLLTLTGAAAITFFTRRAVN